MRVRAEKLGAFHADGPITKSRAFSGAGDNTDVVGHDLILQNANGFHEQMLGRDGLVGREKFRHFHVLSGIIAL
jgi:hypothetical protein